MQLNPGQRINHYILEYRIGHGASGEVWVASTNEQLVAIKFIHQHFTDNTGQLSRLKNEIKALSKFNHPHIPKLYDCDMSFERPYLVMEHIDSPSLEALIASGDILNIPMKQRIQTLFTLAHVITSIHHAGIIHRDIKPASINGIEHPYLLDFSIAISVEDAETANPNIGTGVYMPPPGELPGPLNDNYSFALVAYEMLFGCHPIFTLNDTGKTTLQTRQLAAERIKNHQWRFPGSLPPEALPGDLHGVEVKQLDTIFQRAFTTYYSDVGQLVQEIGRSIITPRNEPFLNSPSPLFKVKPVPIEAHYTDQEVKQDNLDTDLESPVQKSPVQFMLAFMLTSLLGLLIFFILYS